MKKILSIVGAITISALVTVWKTVDSTVIKKADSKVIEKITKKSIKSTYPKISSKILKQLDELSFIVKKQKNGSVKIYSKSNEFLGIIRGNQITALPGNSLTTMNKLLDTRKLFPNFIYKVDNAIYKTDKLGRVIEVKVARFSKSILKKPRSSHRQRIGNFGRNGIKGLDEGGHLIPNQLGGASEMINIFPQNKILNRGKWKKVEKFVTNNRSVIKDYKIKLYYEGVSSRPISMKISYNLRGKKIIHKFKNENT